MKTLTIKLIEWSDIKAWWKDRTDPKRIRENAKDALDYVDGRWSGEVETIINAHYPDLYKEEFDEKYTDFVIDLKETLCGICQEAKKLI